MKNYITAISLFVLLVLSSCSRQVYIFTSFHEPADAGLRLLYSHDGYNWTDFDTTFLKPLVGSQKVMRDPSVVQGPDGTFHLVWTSSWRGDKGFGYVSSKDLIHWSEQRFLPVMEKEPDAINVWAPELFYDDVKKDFIIVWASTIPYRFPRGTETDSNNHRLYYTTTKDFTTFSDTRLFFDPNFSVIDAVIAKRGNNDYVLIHKDNTRPERDIKVAFGLQAEGPYVNSSAPFTPKLSEGPAVVKVGKDWLIYYDYYGGHIYGAAKTQDFKTFTDATKEVHLPEGHKHGTIFRVSTKTFKNLKRYVLEKR